jgi:hypothetical protein
MENYQIEYTITSTSNVISHDLTNDQFDYIIAHLAEITGHDSIYNDTPALEDYVGADDDPVTLEIEFDITTTLIYTAATRVITASGDNLEEGDQVVRIYFQISSGAINDTGQTLYGWLTVILALLVGAFAGVPPIFWASATGFTIYGYLMLFALVVGFVGLALGFIIRLIQK